MKSIFYHTLSLLSRRERRQVLWLALADIAISVADIAMLALLVYVLHHYTQPLANGDAPAKLFLGIDMLIALPVVLLLFAAKNIAGYYANKARFHFAYRVAARLSEVNLLHFLAGDFGEYAGKDASVHIRRTSQQPVEFSHYVLSGFQQLFVEMTMVLLAVSAILLYNAALFALLCLVLAPPLAVLWWYNRKKLATVRANIKSTGEQSLQYLKEALDGYVEANIYQANAFLAQRYARRQSQLNHYLASLQASQAFPARMMELFAVFGLFALILSWTFMGQDGSAYLSITTIAAFMAAAYKIIPGLVKMVNLGAQVRTYAFTLNNLASSQPAQNTQKDNGRITSLALRNAEFSFGGQQVFSNLTIDIKAGELTGISGLSGRGKTTLFNLLAGFLHTRGGSMYINDTPATAADLPVLRRRIAYVKQQPFLLHDSLQTNIALHEKTPDRTRLHRVIDEAGLTSLLAQLPDGLQSVLAENGRNISGGQRQRIALARALFKDADVLLLDEPFSELDAASEQELLRLLQSIAAKGRIVLLVTHNSKALSYCHKIISLDA